MPLDRRAAARRRCARRSSACCSASRACASRACIWRWRPWRRSSSSTGRSCASSGSPTTPPRARSAWPGLQVLGFAIETPGAEVPVLPRLPGRLRAARQEPGARPHRPRMDGDPRHGRRRGRDRHPPHLRQAHAPSPSARSSSASPARCGASSTSGAWEPAAFSSTVRSSCCSWSSSAAWARSWAASSAPPSSSCCRSSSNQPAGAGRPRAHRSTALASHLEFMIFGALIVFFLIVEPHGLARLWSTARRSCGCGPSRIEFPTPSHFNPH